MENNQKETPEFAIDTVVTVDRYNHISDVQKGTIKGYGEMMLSKRLTYKIDINGVEIVTTGISIMESKNYEPVADHERHAKYSSEIFAREAIEDAKWEARRKAKNNLDIK